MNFRTWGLLLCLAYLAACQMAQPEMEQPETKGQNLGKVDSSSQRLVSVKIPEKKAYPSVPQVSMKVPANLVADGDEARYRRFRSIDYETGEVLIEGSARNSASSVAFRIGPWPYQDGRKIFQDWQRYPDKGERKFGLSYRPIEVPGRPEKLLKRGYFKDGVSGEEFHVSCIPPIGPGMISEPEVCAMILMLNPKRIKGRLWGVKVQIGFAESRLHDWAKIERRVRDVVEVNAVIQ